MNKPMSFNSELSEKYTNSIIANINANDLHNYTSWTGTIKYERKLGIWLSINPSKSIYMRLYFDVINGNFVYRYTTIEDYRDEESFNRVIPKSDYQLIFKQVFYAIQDRIIKIKEEKELKFIETFSK